MKERHTPTQPQEKVSVIKHPILAGRLAWTDRRIATFEKTQKQTERIMSLPQVPDSVKNEARVNSERSKTKIFDLKTHREALLKKVNKRVESPVTQTPSYRRSYTQGDDVFGGYDL